MPLLPIGSLPTRLRRRVRRLYHRIVPYVDRAMSPAYRHYCPCCGRRVRSFQPLDKTITSSLIDNGWPYGLDAFETLNVEAYACPYCGASDRDRLYATYLTRTLPAGGSTLALLDIAPTRPLGHYLNRQPTISRRTADLTMVDVDDRVDIQRMTNYADGSFDAFICSHVLEHVEDDRSAMRELFRVLRPGGWGIAMVPICLAVDECQEDSTVTAEADRWRLFAQGDHVRLYSSGSFVERLTEAGFTVHRYGADFFGDRGMRRIGATRGSVLYVVERPVPSGGDAR